MSHHRNGFYGVFSPLNRTPLTEAGQIIDGDDGLHVAEQPPRQRWPALENIFDTMVDLLSISSLHIHPKFMSQSKNRYLIIIILGALSTISPFAIDMYLPAFPQIAVALHTSTARISLSIASYFTGMAAGQLFYGPLLDRFGRKLPLYAGMILFITASILCLCSRTVEWLIAMRFVQALGGCAAQVAAMAMVRDFFPVHETAKIISLLILILSVSPLLAPSVGVFVAVHLGWQWVFVVLS